MSEPAPADHRVREHQMPEALIALEDGNNDAASDLASK
jgi:hypothetical protein